MTSAFGKEVSDMETEAELIIGEAEMEELIFVEMRKLWEFVA